MQLCPPALGGIPMGCRRLGFVILVLERKGKRHLNLPRAADCFRCLAQPSGRVKKTARASRGANRWSWTRALLWKLAEVNVLCDVIDGDIEAGCVRHIKHVKGV